ncbi:MAG: transporter substrate-binding domain-containing protein [Candidatus Magnetomorum sp.]|nr:transporter substrate-binding domain-containing protein [Candidatus Magnetomorum sp.]
MMVRSLLFSLFIVFSINISFCHGVELIFDTQDFPPYSYLENGNVEGPASAIIRQVCTAMNIKCTLQLQSWTRAQYNVKEGLAHGLFLLARNKDRDSWLFFSLPLFKAQYGIFVRQDNPIVFSEPSQLKGYLIGVYGPSNTSRQLELIQKKIPEILIDLRPNDEAGFRKLFHGRDDAVFSNKDVGLMVCKKMKIKGIRYAGTYQSTNYHVGFSQKYNDYETVKQFNAAYVKLYKQGTIKQILQTYDMEPAILDESELK